MGRYISSKRLVHMDIAARNMLLGNGNLIKLADFGLTRPMDPGLFVCLPLIFCWGGWDIKFVGHGFMRLIVSLGVQGQTHTA